MTDRRPDGGTPTLHQDPAATVSDGATLGGHARRLRAIARQVTVLAGSEVRLGLRRRWVLVLAGLFTTFGLLLFTFAGSTPGPAGFERTVASLATLSVYLVPLAALAYGYSAIVGPAERGWFESIAALPVARPTILLGIATGRAVVLAGGVLLGFAVPGLIVVNEFGLAGWPPYAALVLGVTALGLAFLGVAVLCSALVEQKTHALGVALLAWVWFVLVHDLLGLGVVAAFELPAGAVGAVVLANPASTYRVLILEALGASGAGGFGAVGAAAGLSTAVLATGLLVWTVVPVAVAMVTIRLRGAG